MSQDNRPEAAADQTREGHGRDRRPDAAPQRRIGQMIVADNGHRADLLPRVVDLRLTGRGVYRQPALEPLRGIAMVDPADAFDDRMSLGIVDADQLVVLAVEKCHGGQLDRCPVRVVQAERKGQCRCVVGILDRELCFEVRARAQQRNDQAAAEGEQHAGLCGLRILPHGKRKATAACRGIASPIAPAHRQSGVANTRCRRQFLRVAHDKGVRACGFCC